MCVECLGNFSARMGQHELRSRDAVIWFRYVPWKDKQYCDMEVFLWQDAEVRQPVGTIETGPALIITLRTFGKVIQNVDARANTSDDQSELYREALRARGLLDVVPTAKAEDAEVPVQVAPSAEKIRLNRPKPQKRVDFSVGPGGTVTHEQIGEQSVIIAKGEIMLSQGSPAQSGEYLELRADMGQHRPHPQTFGGQDL